MSNAYKKPNHTPESYRPKTKPELLSMMAETLEASGNLREGYRVKTTQGGSYIDSIPLLKWGEYKDSSYCGCVSALLNAMGIHAAYERVMGLSGVCYQAIMRVDWDPSSAMPQNGFLNEKNIGDALGIAVYSLGDLSEIRERTKKSIDEGIPVLLVGGRWAPEWNIVCGYDLTGKEDKFFGRTYFDCQNYNFREKNIEHQSTHVPLDEIYTDNSYFLFNNFPGVVPEALSRFYDEKTQPIPLRQALKNSLDTCIKMFEQPRGEYHRFGYEAYDVLISGFELEDDEYRDKCKNDQYHIGSLIDARRSAAVYLEESVGLLEGENVKKLLETSRIYKKMVENITNAVSYTETTGVFNTDSEPVWDKQKRVKLTSALNENRALEKDARDIVREILANWAD